MLKRISFYVKGRVGKKEKKICISILHVCKYYKLHLRCELDASPRVEIPYPCSTFFHLLSSASSYIHLLVCASLLCECGTSSQPVLPTANIMPWSMSVKSTYHVSLMIQHLCKSHLLDIVDKRIILFSTFAKSLHGATHESSFWLSGTWV